MVLLSPAVSISKRFTMKTKTTNRRKIAVLRAASSVLILGAGAVSANILTVNSLADTALAGDGQCTLREAVNNANNDLDATHGDCAAGLAADKIQFGLSGVITLGSTLAINDVDGITVDGVGQKVTVSGNHAVRVWQVNEGGTFNLKNLTVANGYATSSGFGGIFGGGGAISNQYGIVNVANSTFTGNTTTGNGGAIVNRSNDGLANPGGILTVVNSTFVGNSAFTGGAIANSGTSQVKLVNVSVVGNSAVTEPCAAEFCLAVVSQGGGVANTSLGSISLDNSIVAGNNVIIKRPGGDLIYASDVEGFGLSGANNLIGSSGSGLQNGVNGNITDSDVAIIASTTLVDNGVPSQTLALLPGSPALDNANSANCPGTDQRGISRPQGPGCDIGAHETLAVPTADLAVTGTVSPNPVMVRDRFAALLSITNNGPDNATGVTLIDTLPAGSGTVTANATQGSCGVAAGKVSCNLANLAVGATVNVTIKGTPGSAGTFSNVANVSGNQLDIKPANNAATQSLVVMPLSCQGLTPTLVGTPNNDTLRGTAKRDIIQALSGNDTVYGADGDDVICGGEGNDILKGEKGNDKLDGSTGTDSCDGGAGTDSAINCEAVIATP